MKKKAQVREKMLFQLKNFDKAGKMRQTEAVSREFLADEAYLSADSIGLFMPLDFEFDLNQLTEKARADGKKILLPKTLPNHKMMFIGADGKLEKTKFGILEPVSADEEVPELIVVPGLAWRADGMRLGFGGGYYDRYLANFKGQTVSLAYDFQLTEEFAADSFDIPIERVIHV